MEMYSQFDVPAALPQERSCRYPLKGGSLDPRPDVDLLDWMQVHVPVELNIGKPKS
jgi:hypothetical protein